jgi:undecaprenyl diphosphate synthase
VSYLSDLDLGQLPRHVGIIMDGNGRWAKQRGLTRSDGHSAGEEALFDVVDASIEIGLKWLTVYAFSTENWKRPPTEIRYLMYFNRRLLRNRRDELNERNVRIRFTGRNDWRVPRNVERDMTDAQDLTRANTGLTFTIAFNYGGRTEIVLVDAA